MVIGSVMHGAGQALREGHPASPPAHPPHGPRGHEVRRAARRTARQRANGAAENGIPRVQRRPYGRVRGLIAGENSEAQLEPHASAGLATRPKVQMVHGSESFWPGPLLSRTDHIA